MSWCCRRRRRGGPRGRIFRLSRRSERPAARCAHARVAEYVVGQQFRSTECAHKSVLLSLRPPWTGNQLVSPPPSPPANMAPRASRTCAAAPAVFPMRLAELDFRFACARSPAADRQSKRDEARSLAALPTCVLRGGSERER